jgi:endonuclease G
VLAFLYPHHHLYKQAGPYDHTQYLVSVDQIEELTGLDFLTSLPDNIENKIESAVATSLW